MCSNFLQKQNVTIWSKNLEQYQNFLFHKFLKKTGLFVVSLGRL